MSDEAVICKFMEPKCYGYPWWSCQGSFIAPRALSLDALWEVEERLTRMQWNAYLKLLSDGNILANFKEYRMVAHATAAQKIAALATVLRNEENTDGQ